MHLFCSGAPPRNGCSAPYRVQRPRACGGCRGCGGLLGLSCLLLGSLWRLMLWFLRNVARNSPTCISNVEITSLEFCGFLDTYEKLEYPNYVRVLVDEAPKANSCVRSSSHDTVHDPQDASTWRARLRLRGCGATHRAQLPGSGPEKLTNKAKCGARLP